MVWDRSAGNLDKASLVEIVIGNIAGRSNVNKFGRSDNLDNGVDTDVWDRANTTDNQDIWIAPTQARVHDIASSSPNDAAGDIGARTVRVYGLVDWDTSEVAEDILLDGTNNVATVNSYIIIHRIEVLSKGTSGPNVGTITATAQVDGTVTAQITPGIGQTQMAIYGVPSIQILAIGRIYGSLIRATGANVSAAISLLVNPEPDNELTTFLTRHIFSIYTEGLSSAQVQFWTPEIIFGPAIVKLQGNGSANNIIVSAGFEGILVDRE